MTNPHSNRVTAQERTEAFRQGFQDNSRGVKRENHPYLNPSPGRPALIRAWREGWDKSESGLVVNLPKGEA